MDIREGIEKKRREIEKLRPKLEEAEKDLAAMERTLALLEGKKDGQGAGDKQKAPRAVIKGSSSLVMAKEILREAGKPMHANELVAAFQERGQVVKKDSLVSAILKNIKSENPEFRKTNPNTFALANGVIPFPGANPPATSPGNTRERSA